MFITILLKTNKKRLDLLYCNVFIPAQCRKEGGNRGWRVERETRWFPRQTRRNQASSAVPTTMNQF
jgi:hypothetical protein